MAFICAVDIPLKASSESEFNWSDVRLLTNAVVKPDTCVIDSTAISCVLIFDNVEGLIAFSWLTPSPDTDCRSIALSWFDDRDRICDVVRPDI